MLSKKNGLTFLAVLSSFFSAATTDLTGYTNPDGKTIWDEAPDFKNDEIQLFPDLKGPNGTDLTIENLRGVYLYGWKGCSREESRWVTNAYNDFCKLAQQQELYNNIDWSDQVNKTSFIHYVVFFRFSPLSPSHGGKLQRFILASHTGDQRLFRPE